MAQLAASTIKKIDYPRFSGSGNIFLASGVATILFVLLIPLPTMVLDAMLTLSISLGFVILLSVMYMRSPLEFSIFPSLILVTTLFRLALNVASTRLILLHGEVGPGAAGKVIEAFGQLMVGGNYIVGVIIFLVIFILNKMVITAGTTRIAEVAARFTLDAMPGKQMAIEADLNAGLINEQEAKRSRESIRKEADFYGAMDGAAKFVSGDVTASIIIAVVNIVGGLLIGVFQKGMAWGDAATTFTILTVGDGLVAQIPSLMISTSAGIVVSRAAAEADMGQEFLEQLTRHFMALRLVAVILFILSLVPGMPTLIFILFAGLLWGISIIASRQHQAAEKMAAQEGKPKSPSLDTPEEVQALLPLDVLEMEVGYGLIPLVDEDQNGNLLARIRSIRRQFALDMGVIIPSLHLRDNLQLKPGQYVILIKRNQVASAEILIDHYLAMDPGDAKHRIQGVETKEPAFNLPALWIPERQKDEAMLAGYTVVDPSTVVATHVTEVFRRNLSEFLGRQEVQALLDNLAKRAPKAVEELVPGIMILGTVQRVLQNLVRENVSIRDMLTIVETLADFGPSIKDPDLLTEYVRVRMARTIVKPYFSPDRTLPVIILDQEWERLLQDNLRKADQTTYLNIDPTLAQKLIQGMQASMEKAMLSEGQPVVLTTPSLRPHLAQLVTRFIPTLPIISQAEIPSGINLHSAATVRMNHAG